MNSTLFLFPDILSKYRVLIYQGNFDFRDGVISNTAWLDKLQWEYFHEWAAVEPVIWQMNYTINPGVTKNTLAGKVQAHRNLTRVVLWNAGHFVPAPNGNPEAAYEMIKRQVQKPIDLLPDTMDGEME